MELDRYLSIVRKWWWLILASVAVAVASSYVSVSRAPRIYRATMTLVVGQGLGQSNPDPQEVWLSEQLARTYADMASRRAVLQGVIEALDLPYTPVVLARSKSGTNFLEIAVHDTDPERARVIAEEVTRQLILHSPAASSEVQQRQAFIQNQLRNLETDIQGTEEQIKAEQEQLEAASSARAIEEHRGNIHALQQKLSSYQSTYASLLQSVEPDTNQISVIEPATSLERPISPKVAETVGMAAAVGFGLAIAGMLVLEYLDDTIKTPEDVMRSIELPTLGAIARINGQEHPEKLVVVQHPRSPVSEAYRVLRTNIQFSGIDSPIHTLMVTSPNPIEGKSVTVANLGAVMAQAGLSVIVVDSDLRRPVMHKIFALDNSHGLSDAILKANPGVIEHVQPVSAERLLPNSEDAGLETRMEGHRPTYVDNLQVMTSGPPPPNPAELLGSGRMKYVINQLRRKADIILFDSPPVLAVADAAVLATQVDGVLIVNDAGRTRRALAKRAVERLRGVDAHLLGVVLNRLPSQGKNHYYYYAEEEDRGRRTRRRRSSRESQADPSRGEDRLREGKEPV